MHGRQVTIFSRQLKEVSYPVTTHRPLGLMFLALLVVEQVGFPWVRLMCQIVVATFFLKIWFLEIAILAVLIISRMQVFS